MNIQLLNELENILTDILNQTRNTGHSARQNAHQYPHSYSPQPHVYMSPHNMFQGHPRLDYTEISNHTLYKIQQATNILTKLLDVPGTPVVNVDLEILKIQERLDKLEMSPKPVQEFTWDELQTANRKHQTSPPPKRHAENNPWEYIYHKFTNMVNYTADSVLIPLLGQYPVAQPANKELNSLLSYISTEGRRGGSVVNMVSSVYRGTLNKPGVYLYSDTNQRVVITPPHDGKVYIVIFNAAGYLIFDMYCVHREGDDGRHKVVPNFDIKVLCEIHHIHNTDNITTPNASTTQEEVQEQIMYRNTTNIEGMRDRIIEMRKHIDVKSIPKKVLLPVLEKIGKTDMTGFAKHCAISADEHELLTHVNAVYSMPVSRIRIVVVNILDRTVLMVYNCNTYIVHDVYKIVKASPSDNYLISRSAAPLEDLEILLNFYE